MGWSTPEAEFTAQVFTDCVPPFVENSLDRLYGSLYASLPQLLLSPPPRMHTYVARRAGELCAVFLYHLDGTEVRVLNEGMQVDADDAGQFAQAMFERHPSARRVRFHAVRLQRTPSALPAVRHTVSADMVIALPASGATYLDSLGKATRKSLRQRLARAAGTGLAHRVIDGALADRTMVDAIVDFNHARLARQQRQSALNQRAREQLLQLMHARGKIGLLTLNGKLCAGTLAFLLGEDMYSLVNAHDPAHDRLGLGNISLYLMICEAIRSGVRRFHLLGGNFRSKRAWCAQRVPLDTLLLYRDRRAQYWHAIGIAELACGAALQRLRVALEDEQEAARLGGAERGALALMQLLRRWRQRGAGSLS